MWMAWECRELAQLESSIVLSKAYTEPAIICLALRVLAYKRLHETQESLGSTWLVWGVLNFIMSLISSLYASLEQGFHYKTVP